MIFVVPSKFQDLVQFLESPWMLTFHHELKNLKKWDHFVVNLYLTGRLGWPPILLCHIRPLASVPKTPT